MADELSVTDFETVPSFNDFLHLEKIHFDQEK